ncbi:hypothetical protein ACFLRF_00155 [Candidatus Altiarchaeota archaeon]
MKKKALTDERIILSLFALSCLVFFASSTGMNDSNSGSHFALVKALSEKQTFVIDEYVRFTGTIDAANVNGTWYSDRPPGTAFIGSIFYTIGNIFDIIIDVPSFDLSWDAGNPGAFTVIFLPVISASLGLCIFYLILRELGGSVNGSLLTSLALGSCTLTWEYSQLLFSHAQSLAIILAIVYLAITMRTYRKDKMRFNALCFLAGYSCLIEYPNALLIVPVAGYLHLTGKLEKDPLKLRNKAFRGGAIAFMIPLIVLGGYNTWNFGSPLRTSYSFNHHFEWARSFTTTFVNPIFEGSFGLLIDHPKMDAGLLTASPVLALALIAWPGFLKKKRPEALLFASLFLIHLVLYAKHRTFFGGGTHNARYLLTVTPYLLAPLFLFLDEHVLDRKNKTMRFPAAAVFILLAGWSAANMVDGIIHFPGHEPFEMVPMDSFGAVSLNAKVLFRNYRNLPFLAGLLGISYGLASLRGKRALGFTQKQMPGYKDYMTGLVILSGILLIMDVNLGFDRSFIRWELAEAGGWKTVEMPVTIKGPGYMKVRGIFELSSPAAMKGILTATECIENTSINGRGRINFNCTRCMHCDGVKYDLGNSGYVFQGLNRIEFDVRSDQDRILLDVK